MSGSYELGGSWANVAIPSGLEIGRSIFGHDNDKDEIPRLGEILPLESTPSLRNSLSVG